MANIGDSIEYVLLNEGGYSDIAEDHGGPTNEGITLETLSRFLGRPCSAHDVETMQKSTAVAIYKANYWMPLGLDHVMDQNVATCIFDCGVNRGLHTAVVYAQYACNGLGQMLEVDGHMGPKTLSAINKVKRADFIENFHEEVVEGYKEIIVNHPSQEIFKVGWLARADRLLTLINDQMDLH